MQNNFIDPEKEKRALEIMHESRFISDVQYQEERARIICTPMAAAMCVPVEQVVSDYKRRWV